MVRNNISRRNCRQQLYWYVVLLPVLTASWHGLSSRSMHRPRSCLLTKLIFGQTLVDMNACSSGYGCKSGDGALEAFGLCYNGPQPMWMAEYTGNHMLRSNGISLKDGITSNDVCNASSYPGPFTRWQVVRRNSIAGVALSQTECGTISLSGGGVSTDVVVESNTFHCPPGKTQPPIQVNCSHCRVQNIAGMADQ